MADLIPWPDDDYYAPPPTIPALPTQAEARRSLLGRVLSRAELADLPKPEPLITDWLDLRTSVLLIGETGTNKTFTALGWACAVATGTDWLGHKVCLPPTPVLYVVGEGAYGLNGRISAWEEHTGADVPPESLTIVMQPLSLHAPETWDAITAEALDRAARLVVLDTFSSLAPDADETTDAAQIVRRMADLAVRLDGTVVLVHHTGWSDKSRARGGSQLEANPDAVVLLEKTSADPDARDAPVSITRKKVKDGEAGGRLWVMRSPVDLPDFERPQAVLVEAPAPSRGATGGVWLAELQGLIMNVLTGQPEQFATKTRLRDLTRGRAGEIGVRFSNDKFAAAFAGLESDGLVTAGKGLVQEGSRSVDRDGYRPSAVRVETVNPSTRPGTTDELPRKKGRK